MQPSFFSSKNWIKLIPKTIGNRKRDCAWGFARGIDTTWENLQIEKAKAQIRKAFVAVTGLICAFRSADFLRWCLSPSATSRTISFSISNSFWYYGHSKPGKSKGAVASLYQPGDELSTSTVSSFFVQFARVKYRWRGLSFTETLLHSFCKFVLKWDSYGQSKLGKSKSAVASPYQLYQPPD